MRADLANPVSEAHALCIALTRAHYENFPTASYLLPPPLRPAVAAIYAFARTADDFADEHDLEDSTRLTLLQVYTDELKCIENGMRPRLPILVAVADAVARHGLPLGPFYDLLSAFRQDVVKNRYANFEEVHDYCKRSANPIGHLMLALFGRDEPALRAQSDDICTGLQLINFWQDIVNDVSRGRVYLPDDEQREYGVNAEELCQAPWSENAQRLMRYQIERAASFVQRGAPLHRALSGRAALQIKATVNGAMVVVDKLRGRRHGADRARLKARDWATILVRTFFSPR